MAKLTDKEERQIRQQLPAVAPERQEYKITNVGDWRYAPYTYVTLAHALEMLRTAREAGWAGATIELKACK
jgi:hypothetical protein